MTGVELELKNNLLTAAESEEWDMGEEDDDEDEKEEKEEDDDADEEEVV